MEGCLADQASSACWAAVLLGCPAAAASCPYGLPQCMGTFAALHEHLSGLVCAWETGLAVHARQPHCWTALEQLAACSVPHPGTPAEQSDCEPDCRMLLGFAALLCRLLSGLSFAEMPEHWPAIPARLTQVMPSHQVFQMLSGHQRTDPHLFLRWPLSGQHLGHHLAD